MNKIIISGKVSKEPTITVKDGKTIARISLPVPRQSNREVTDWFNVVAFGPLAEKLIKPFIHKGTKILVIGEMQFGSYENKDGQKVNTSSVIISDIELIGEKPITAEAEELVNEEDVEDTTINDSTESNLPF